MSEQRSLPEAIEGILLDEARITERVCALAGQISADYADIDDLLLVGVLKGAFIFLADLTRQLTVAHRVDFIALSSYNRGAESAGAVRLIMDTRTSVTGHNVLIVEDILDTGLTLSYIFRNLERRKPASLKVCVLLDRPYRRLIDIPIAYKGFDAPDEFLVGYGLDWRQQYRSLPYIGIIKPEVLRAEMSG